MRDNFDVHEWNIQQVREANGLEGFEAFKKTLEFLRSKIYPKLSDDEMDKFVVEMCKHLDCEPPAYRLNENKDYLEKLADNLGKKFPDLKFNINNNGPRIDVRGSQQDMANWGSKHSGKKYGEYEVFHTDDDDQGEIVRIVKSSKISKG